MASSAESRNAMIVTALLALLFLFVAAGAVPASASIDQCVAYQINSQHNGCIETGNLTPPLVRKWYVQLPSAASYPLIADGKVFFVLHGDPTAVYGNRLCALDAETGRILWGPVNLGGLYWCGAAAYEDGRVIVVNGRGLMRAFNGGDGQLLWSTQLLGQTVFDSPPTALNGIVYTLGEGIGATVYAVKVSDGTVLWTKLLSGGDHSSPVVTEEGVYFTFAKARSYKLHPLTGEILWYYSLGLAGGGGRTPAYHQGRLYGRTYPESPAGYVLDSISGSLIGRYSVYWTDPIPAFWNDMRFFLYRGTLEARNLNTDMVAWSFSGDGGLCSAPLIVNGYVYICSASRVFALDPISGQLVWDAPGGSPAPDERSGGLLTGMGAGEGILVVPSYDWVAAYEHLNRAPAVTCPDPSILEATSPSGAEATVSVQISDPDNDALIVQWLVDGETVKEDTIPAGSSTDYTLTMTMTYGIGAHTVQVNVSDQKLSASGYTGVTVQDTTAPSLVPSLGKSMLWPPNGELRDVGLTYSAPDICDTAPAITVIVYSDLDDEEKTGEEITSPDAKIGESLHLRAERLGESDGRIYLIVVTASDSSGNTAFDCCAATVPQSLSKSAVETAIARAQAAQAYCRANYGSAPPGYCIVGDGPTIGPKQ